MERITYRKTLDVHKNGTQFVLRGFETSEKLSRIVEISLMASGDAIDFPLENIMALMYISSPGSELPTIKECEIKDNKIICEVSPLVTEGISTVQISLMETRPSGASSVLYTPKFSIEVTKSIVNDTALEQNSDFGILKNAITAAKTVYDQRFLRMELTDDCIFKAYYADGSWYETDILKKLFKNGNVLLSESFAHGNTGTRIGEDTDNAMYYSNLAKSEALNAKEILEESEGVLDEVRKQGVYTAFTLDFNTGEIEYASPSFAFEVNTDTGKLDVIGQSYSFDEEIYRLITMWLAQNGVVLTDLEKISTNHSEEIGTLQEVSLFHTGAIETLNEVRPIEQGGTGVSTLEALRNTLTIDKLSPLSSYLSFIGNNADMVSAAFGKANEDDIVGVGKALKMYAKFKGDTSDIDYLDDYDSFVDLVKNHKSDLTSNPIIYGLIESNPYALDTLKNTLQLKPDIVLYDKAETEYLDIPNATIYNYEISQYLNSPWASYGYNLNTKSNLSLTKSSSAHSSDHGWELVFKYTIPLLKNLPNLSGYRFLNIQLADNEVSKITYNWNGARVHLSVGGVDANIIEDTGVATELSPEIITGKKYSVDLLSDFADNPTAEDVVLSIYISTFSAGAYNSILGQRGRTSTVALNIDKIWISEE